METRLKPVEHRTVLITSGMTLDCILMCTDAPKEIIEDFCRSSWKEDNDYEMYYKILYEEYDTLTIFDSSKDTGRHFVHAIGYKETYDLYNYYDEEYDEE